ncbi:MAG: glycosyltransferase [Muribaculaceae bacterium]|nr:glycosyltransferase [Muribaculaceae bacterium]
MLKALNSATNGVSVDLLTLRDPEGRIYGNCENWIHGMDYDSKTPLEYSRNTRRYLRETDYDLYHLNGLWLHTNHSTCSTARKKGKPYIITPHGMLYPQTLRAGYWKKWIVSKLWFDKDIHEATCIHATCREEMEHIRYLTGYRGPIAIIPNTIEIPDYTIEIFLARASRLQPRSTIRIGFLGRIHPRKHVEAILHAVSMRPGLDIEVEIIGDGLPDYMRYLKETVRKLRLEDKVEFTGFVSGREKYDRIAHLTALFVPSDMENFGMIVPEALLVGTPVMASLGTPWQSLEKNKCGWWRDNSPESLASVIDEIASLSGSELLEMGRRGHDYVISTLSPEMVASKMINLYKKIVSGTKLPELIE